MLGLGQVTSLAVGTNVEADDGGVGRRRQRDVVLRHATDRAVHEGQLHLVALQALQALGDGFERTLHVGLQHQVQGGHFAGLDLREHVLQLHATLNAGVAALGLGAQTLFARFADGSGGLFVGSHTELVTGVGHARQTEHLHGGGGAGFLDLLALVVDHGAHASPRTAGHDGVAHLERSLVDEDGRHGTTTGVEVGFQHHTLGAAGRVRRELFDLGDQGELFDEVVDTQVLLGRHLDTDGVTAPGLGNEFLLGQLRQHALHVGVLLVDLVDGHDHGHTGRAGVADGLDGLGHHTVVGSHHQHDDVGHLRTTGAHLGERRVTRGVDEGDLLAVLVHLIRTDVLGDATGFTGHHVGVADLVEQRRLTVVDVTHDGDDRRTRSLGFLVVVVAVVEQRLQFQFFLLARFDQQQFGADLEGEQFHLLVGERHGGGHHFAVLHEEQHDVGRGAIQTRRELLSRHTTLDDDGALGHRRAGGAVALHRGLQLFLTTTSTTTTTTRCTTTTTGARATTGAAPTGTTGTTTGATGTTGATAGTRATEGTGCTSGTRTTRTRTTETTGTRCAGAGAAVTGAARARSGGRSGPRTTGGRRNRTTRGRHGATGRGRRDRTTRGRHRSRRGGRGRSGGCGGGRGRGSTRCRRGCGRAGSIGTRHRSRRTRKILGGVAARDHSAGLHGRGRFGRRGVGPGGRTRRCHLGHRSRHLGDGGRCRRRGFTLGLGARRGGGLGRGLLRGRLGRRVGGLAVGVGFGRLLGGLGRLGFLGLYVAHQTLRLGLAFEQRDEGVSQRRLRRLGGNSLGFAEVQHLGIGHTELLGEFAYFDLGCCHATFSPSLLCGRANPARLITLPWLGGS